VVTTNLQHAIDAAFMRRFRFTIGFEMPKAGERERLWRTQVPPKAPLEKDVDFKVLAEKYKVHSYLLSKLSASTSPNFFFFFSFLEE
jgi:AAA+ superfamily predicted ATPase